jgi:hypothetical protein
MNAMLIQLMPLVSELQELAEWPLTELSAGLLLYDVLICLGAPEAELGEFLGRELLILIESPAMPDAKRTPPVLVC